MNREALKEICGLRLQMFPTHDKFMPMNNTASPIRKAYYRCTHGAKACFAQHRTAKAALACCPEYKDVAAIKRVTSYPEHDSIVTTFYRRDAYMPNGWAIQ